MRRMAQRACGQTNDRLHLRLGAVLPKLVGRLLHSAGPLYLLIIGEWDHRETSITCVRCQRPFAFGTHSANSQGTSDPTQSKTSIQPPLFMALISKMPTDALPC